MVGDLGQGDFPQSANTVGAELTTPNLGIDLQIVRVLPTLRRRWLTLHVSRHVAKREPAAAKSLLKLSDVSLIYRRERRPTRYRSLKPVVLYVICDWHLFSQ